MISGTENPKTGTRDLGLGTWKKRKSAIRNPKSAIRNPQSTIGFTLVELLVVISIISLLVGIMIPSVSLAIREAANTRTGARVAALSGACVVYHDKNDYYPGQLYSSELGSNSAGKFTGSQWLAKSLFYDPAASSGSEYPKPEYAPLKATEDLIDPIHNDGTFDIGTIADRNKSTGEFMAILYYPSRPGVSGLGQYRMSDNSDYKNNGNDIVWKSSEGSGTDQAAFENYIKDRRFKSDASTTPYSPEAFLLIAAGRDRIYGTSDDIHHPTFKSN